jgi:acyl-CoA reductase-like NAD-dependent aldehyde dehydrogenase
VQRILVHRDVYERVRDGLVAATKVLVHGDPRKEDTFIGPMIDLGEAKRLHGWIEEAVAGGAKVLCGGQLDGTLLRATLLEDVPRRCSLYDEEAFGPVAILAPFDRFEDALAEVNDSKFGLQTGVFTRDLYRAQQAFDTLEVGGVIIGDVPSWRVDHMPYGGVKDSGLGREGVRWAMEDMSEVRLQVVRTPG